MLERTYRIFIMQNGQFVPTTTNAVYGEENPLKEDFKTEQAALDALRQEARKPYMYSAVKKGVKFIILPVYELD